MTSNIGSRQLKDFGQGVGFGTQSKMDQSNEHSKSVIENALKKAFAPEFLNRIDDIIVFNALEKQDIHKIIDIELEKLYVRLRDLEYHLILKDEAKEFIADKGFDKQYGARPLKRAIQKYIEDPLAEQIVNAKIQAGDEIQMSLNLEKDALEIQVTTAQKPTN